ncbi:MAG: hypothetical protein U5L96_08510 [Owenweeksia sp.]|nr:hypothetical protein [Owenweeksia sp.]
MNKSKIDINTVIGLLLIGGIFLYFGYFSQDEPPVEGEGSVRDTTVVEQSNEKAGTAWRHKIPPTPEQATSGIVDTSTALPQQGSEEFFKLENDLVELQFSTKGGQLVKARVKNYQTYDSLALVSY